MAEKSESGSLRDVLRLIFRRRYFFIIGSALLANMLLFAGLSWSAKYTGTTKLRRRTDPVVEEKKNQAESFETIKLTLREELIGQRALENVVEQLGLVRGEPRDSSGKLTRRGQIVKDGIVRTIADGVLFVWEVRKEKMDLVALSVTHSNPQLAQDIPDRLVDNYISGVHEQSKNNLTVSLQHLQKKVDECKTRLSEQTNIKITFEEKHSGMMPDRPGNLHDRIQQTIADLEREQRTLDAAKLTLARIESRWREVDTDKTTKDGEPIQEIRGPNPELVRLKEQLELFEDALETATINRTDNHPDVISLRAKLAEIHEKIDQAPAETVLQKVYAIGAEANRYAPEVASISAEIKIRKEAIVRLTERLDYLNGVMSNFVPVRHEWEEIIRKQTTIDKELNGYEVRTARIREELANEVAGRRIHLEVVQRAKEQFQPSSPKLFVILAMALIGGLSGGAGLVFLTHSLDRSITTTDEASEILGLRVHGVIGEITTPAQAIRKRTFNLLVIPLIGLALTLMTLAGCASNVLRLKYPDRFQKWKDAPVGYVFNGMFSSEEDEYSSPR